MRFPLFTALTAALVLANVPAATARHRQQRVLPSADAVQLAGIAPPTRRGTALQTYGDAEIARAEMQRRYRPEEMANGEEVGRTGGAPYPCEPRLATADAYVCRNDPRVLGYGQGYAFTPSYVSAPTVFGQDPREQAPLMPNVTDFFWAVNSARFDPHR